MDQMLSDDSVAVIASAVTPWKRACAGQRLLKMCESFQSAATGAATVITLARVSRPRPSSGSPRAAAGGVIGASDRLEGWRPHGGGGRAGGGGRGGGTGPASPRHGGGVGWAD